MAELLNRELQKEILSALAAAYPGVVASQDLLGKDRSREAIVNLAYLEEHGLASAKWSAGRAPDGVAMAKITAKGIDFLRDDGGLSAILGLVVVKLHEDSIKALLIAKVQQSNEEESAKKKVIEQIKALPAELLKLVATRTLEEGLSKIPQLAQFLAGLMT